MGINLRAALTPDFHDVIWTWLAAHRLARNIQGGRESESFLSGCQQTVAIGGDLFGEVIA